MDDKEIDRREKIRLKRDKEIAKEKEAIEAMNRQTENADRMQSMYLLSTLEILMVCYYKIYTKMDVVIDLAQ